MGRIFIEIITILMLTYYEEKCKAKRKAQCRYASGGTKRRNICIYIYSDYACIYCDTA